MIGYLLQQAYFTAVVTPFMFSEKFEKNVYADVKLADRIMNFRFTQALLFQYPDEMMFNES